MLKAVIKQGSIVIKNIELPETARELYYGMYLDYEFMQTEMTDWIAGQMKRGKNFEYQYTTKIAKCIGYVFGINDKQLYEMKYKDMAALEVLWDHLEKVISTYKPKDNGGTFEVVNGTEKKIYTIPEIVKTYFKGSNNLPEMSMLQMEQIGDAENKLQDAIKQIDNQFQKEIKGDVLGRGKKKAQVTFNNTLKKIALCINEPDAIPLDSTFDLWIEKESKHLTKISMEDALNTIFFLIGLPKDYGKLIGLRLMSNLLNLDNNQMKNLSNTQLELIG